MLVRMVDLRGDQVLVHSSDVGPAQALGWRIADTPPPRCELPIVRAGEAAAQQRRAQRDRPGRVIADD